MLKNLLALVCVSDDAFTQPRNALWKHWKVSEQLHFAAHLDQVPKEDSERRHGARDDRAVQGVCLRRRCRPRRRLSLQEGRLRSRGRRRSGVVRLSTRRHLRRSPLGDLVAFRGMFIQLHQSFGSFQNCSLTFHELSI